jgi:hypothetical protein
MERVARLYAIDTSATGRVLAELASSMHRGFCMSVQEDPYPKYGDDPPLQ